MKYDKDLSCPKGRRAKGLEIRRISEDLGSPLFYLFLFDKYNLSFKVRIEG